MAKSTRRTPRAGPHERNAAEGRLAAIRTELTAIDYICSGTLLSRTKVCGKPNCACASSRDARHGPYYEWSRLEKGRLAHIVLPADSVPLFRQAVANYRRLRRLLRKWERDSVKVALAVQEGKFNNDNELK